MEHTSKSKKRSVGAMITGTILSGALLSAGSASATELFSYEDLGSGAELRSDLLDASTNGLKAFEASCGEKGEKKEESKAAEHKCGEGKCGEGKCGEGKCGEEHKASEKSEKKSDKAKDEMKPRKKSGETKTDDGSGNG